MGRKQVRGVVAPCVTPFNEDGYVDIDLVQEIVGFLSGKVHWITVGGIYGSGIMMDIKERKRLLDAAVRVNKDNSNILFFVGATSTDAAVELAKHAEKVKANAVSCVEPIYYRQVNEAIYLHYEQIIKEVDIPVYVYDSPVFSGNEVSLDNLISLSDAGLAGIITGHAGLGIEHLWKVMRSVNSKKLDILSIRDGLALPSLMSGAVGFESGVANFLPELVIELYEAIEKKNYDRAVILQDRVLRIRDISHMFGRNIPSLHALIGFRGVKSGFPKRPFYCLSQNEVNKLWAGLEKIEGVSELMAK